MVRLSQPDRNVEHPDDWSRPFTVTAIEPKWLTEVAPQFFKVADAARISKRKRDEKIIPLFDKYAEHPDDWRLSRLKKMHRTSQTF